MGANSNSNSQAKANDVDRNRRLLPKQNSRNNKNIINVGHIKAPDHGTSRCRGGCDDNTGDPGERNPNEDKGNFDTEKIKERQDKNERENAQYARSGGASIFNGTLSNNQGASILDGTPSNNQGENRVKGSK